MFCELINIFINRTNNIGANMLFLFFLIILGILGGCGYYLINKYENTISTLKVKLNLMNSEMTKLLSNQSASALDNFNINFLELDKDSAILNANSDLYLFPASVSPVLSSNSEEINVNVLVKAAASNFIWYFISSDSSDSLNTKGWVTESSLSFKETDITNNEAE